MSISRFFAAIFLGYLLFVASVKIPLKKYFTATSVLLLLFAAGLVAHSVHEFEEAGLLPPIIEHLWDLNPEVNLDGSYPALHEKGIAGEFLNGLFGYNANPSLLEVFSYAGYLVILAIVWKRIEGKNKNIIVAQQ